MIRILFSFCCIQMLLVAVAAAGQETANQAPEAPAEEAAKEAPPEVPPGGDKMLSGMSIVGNDEAPKSLVIVPWKTSALGHEIDVSRALDDGRQPVDRDVFMRELEYYQIGAESLVGSEGQ